MNKSITQDTQNDNQISKTIRRFFTRFHVSSALKAVNAYKERAFLLWKYFNICSCWFFSIEACI